MALRRLVVQTRRLLHGRKWSNSLTRDFWMIALQRNFYIDRYRSNPLNQDSCRLKYFY
jgi:hypothetical protein